MISIKSLEGKRILITSWSYASFGGAALNSVELAEKLIEFGMVPTFFSYDIEGPLRRYMESKFNTTVLTDQVYKLADSDSEEDMGNTQLDINDFDYVWVGGSTLPIAIINQINSAKKLPKFIFIHMSPLVGFPLDAPLMPKLEKGIASKILSISSTTTSDNIERIMGDDAVVDYWKNPVPDEFKHVPEPNGKLRRVAVISSNYPSDEIIEIGDLLSKKGVNVEYVGKFNDNEKVVDADFYGTYDLIIGIGKDARYALVSGVPVYVYGRFGGCGYLSSENIELAEAHNFSGRGFSRKGSEDIAKEVISGYGDAISFHQANKNKFVKDMTLGSVVKKIFSDLEDQSPVEVEFDDEYINWLVTSQINIIQRIQAGAARVYWRKKTSDLRRDGEIQRSKIDSMQDKIDKLKLKKSDLDMQVSNFNNSISWRITAPLRKLSRFYKDLFRHPK